MCAKPARDDETLSSLLDDLLPLIAWMAIRLNDERIRTRLREHHRRRADWCPGELT